MLYSQKGPGTLEPYWSAHHFEGSRSHNYQLMLYMLKGSGTLVISSLCTVRKAQGL